MIKATIVKDSTSWLDVRLTTMVLEYPRYIHADFMTHRVFNRNASSTRAVPYSKFKQRVIDNSFYPSWTWNKKGMQGEPVTDNDIISQCNEIWDETREDVFKGTDKLAEIGIHKQHVNRLMEPFQTIQVLVTFTDIDNFFTLRDHKDAQPEIQELAKKIRKAYNESVPHFLKPGEWHIPFGDDINTGYGYNDLEDETKLKVSVARCARISYVNVDGTISDIDNDLRLFDQLITQRPLHASPAEHQARVPFEDELDHFNCYWTKKLNNGNPKWVYVRGIYHSNLQGWIQYRKYLEYSISINE